MHSGSVIVQICSTGAFRGAVYVLMCACLCMRIGERGLVLGSH